MTERTIKAGVLVLVLLAAAPALATGGGWRFNAISTLDYTGMGWGPPYDYVDGRIYLPGGGGLVADGSLVQIIVGVDGADIVDPIEHFDANDDGVISGYEIENLLDWLVAGADPADISGGTNVLAYGTLGFTGEFGTVGGAVDWTATPGSEPVIANGLAQDMIAWRAWNVSKEDLLKWAEPWNHPELPAWQEIWYTTGREFGTHANTGGGPDTGWWIGMPDMAIGGDPAFWAGFNSPIGAEVFDYWVMGNTSARSENRLDHYTIYFIWPEPDALWLVASALALFAARGWRKRARRAAE